VVFRSWAIGNRQNLDTGRRKPDGLRCYISLLMAGQYQEALKGYKKNLLERSRSHIVRGSPENEKAGWEGAAQVA